MAQQFLQSQNIHGVPAFEIGSQMVVGLDKGKIENLTESWMDYNVVSCPACASRMRIPKGKGRIHITCPKCDKGFEKAT